MPDTADHRPALPPEQQRIQAQCYHPAAPFEPSLASRAVQRGIRISAEAAGIAGEGPLFPTGAASNGARSMA